METHEVGRCATEEPQAGGAAAAAAADSTRTLRTRPAEADGNDEGDNGHCGGERDGERDRDRGTSAPLHSHSARDHTHAHAHGQTTTTMPPNKRRKKQKNREFDFSRYHERHVALRIAYLGMAYHGFAAQGPDDVDSTVEAVLLIALQRACLIQDRVSSRYSRCGRTDKGVSAFGQVISICLRTNLTAVTGANEAGFVEKESALDAAVQRKLIDSPKEELDFVHLANRLLPDDIRVTAWSPVADDFDARFSAASRSYKYFFLREDNDIEQMRAAAKLFIGVHDFRNFCKMDIAGGVTNFKRKIMSVTISPADSTVDTDPEYGMYCIDVCGQAFVWHQIRCMAAVLFMVGRGDETPEIIPALLDVETNPRKPQYAMADDLPLVLYDCKFPGLVWRYGAVSLGRIATILHSHFRQAALTGAVVKSMLQGLRAAEHPDPDPETAADATVPWTATMGYARRPHIALLKRATAETFEVKVEVQRLKVATKEAAASELEPGVAGDSSNPV